MEHILLLKLINEQNNLIFYKLQILFFIFL